MGNSAGGSAIDYLLVNPQVSGYYQQAIVLSATPYFTRNLATLTSLEILERTNVGRVRSPIIKSSAIKTTAVRFSV